ncbi:MAG: PQQ-binding-like beta-propeller repeat protein [Treponema sp.]|jgi:outer membrane protein assembly factor BamB|nr:PQQ-binding-like beta-propeller repeat protein [Treponema sp.]
MKAAMRFPFLISLLLLPLAVFSQSGPAPDRERGRVDAEPLWVRALGGEVTGLPAAQVQSAVVALDGGNIKAYSSGGALLWNYSARGRISPFVSRSREGTSYISRVNGALIAVNRAGRELWRRNPGGPLSGPVVSGWDGRLFVPTGDTLSCYTASGNLLWTRRFTEPIRLSPRLDQGGGVLLALEKGEALRVDPFGGALVWKLSSPPELLVSLSAVSGGASEKKTAWQRAPRVMALYENGTMEILGNPDEWYMPADPGESRSTLPRLSSPPLAAASRGNMAAITQRDGRTLLLSVDERKILWTGDTHIRLRSASAGETTGGEKEVVMLYDERGIYVLSTSGATGFTADGRRLWFTTLENTAAVPAFGEDGVLYAGGQNWILNAYKIEDRTRFQRQSLYGPAPEGSYGTGSPPPSPWADYPFRFEEREMSALLDGIGKAILSGSVGENELSWTAYLMEAAGAEYQRPGASITHPAVQPQYRLRALMLLANIGSRETIPFLTNVFRKDTDPVIRAAAAEAIGRIGVDPDGIAIQAFLEAMSPSAVSHDENVLIAVAAATGSLCRFSGPPLSYTGVKILTMLSSSGLGGEVERQARRELGSLRPGE